MCSIELQRPRGVRVTLRWHIGKMAYRKETMTLGLGFTSHSTPQSKINKHLRETREGLASASWLIGNSTHELLAASLTSECALVLLICFNVRVLYTSVWFPS